MVYLICVKEWQWDFWHLNKRKQYFWLERLLSSLREPSRRPSGPNSISFVKLCIWKHKWKVCELQSDTYENNLLSILIGLGHIPWDFLDEELTWGKNLFLSLLRYKFLIYIPVEDLLLNTNLLICIIALSSEIRMFQLCVLFIVVMSGTDLVFDLCNCSLNLYFKDEHFPFLGF